MKKNVILTTQFSATHHWPDCPIHEVAFLKYPHRHVFHITMKFPVKHNDRDIEFIHMKDKVNAFIKNKYDSKFIGTVSCEDIAQTLLEKFHASYVRVMEDNENGAEIEKEN